jgi:hypothetical protein
MNARDQNTEPVAPAMSAAGRVGSIDWERVGQDLDARGNAVIERLITALECNALSALYPIDAVFRTRVVMQQHGFGRGEYRYFAYPLPDLVAQLRCALYPRLVPIANRWNTSMSIEAHYPEQHADFVERCHRAGQLRPTPLLLQ